MNAAKEQMQSSDRLAVVQARMREIDREQESLMFERTCLEREADEIRAHNPKLPINTDPF